MLIKLFVKQIFRDTVKACGLLTLVFVVILFFNPQLSVSRNTLFQICLLGFSLASFKLAFLDFEGHDASNQLKSYIVFSTTGGLSLLALLFFLTPGGFVNRWDLIISIMIPVFAVKQIANSMMYFSTRKDAIEVNQKLDSITKQ
ncbi:MAG: hypothetical protein PHC86_06425 [Eubacteriales bacterium]|nr:hypothetical protein [Eubacteriales bacterium]